MKLSAVALLFFASAVLITSCISEQDIEFKRAYTAGEVVYYKKCQNCHGDKGEGLSALMPPLTDSVYLKKNGAQLACVVMYGLNNKLIIVGGKPYQNQMPPSVLAPIEIAQVLTYIKNSFGNKQGMVNLNQVNGNLQGCK